MRAESGPVRPYAELRVVHQPARMRAAPFKRRDELRETQHVMCRCLQIVEDVLGVEILDFEVADSLAQLRQRNACLVLLVNPVPRVLRRLKNLWQNLAQGIDRGAGFLSEAREGPHTLLQRFRPLTSGAGREGDDRSCQTLPQRLLLALPGLLPVEVLLQP